MTNQIRSFIALELTPGIQQKLAGAQKFLKTSISEGVKWVPLDNIHITLKFLGDVRVEDIELIKHGLKQTAGKFQSIGVSVTRLGAFPGMSKPRVIWIGLEADPSMESLVNNIENLAKNIGYPGDAKPFTPHLTLGRTAKSINSKQQILISNFLKSAPIHIDMQDKLQIITLFQSSLTPAGAVYSPLYSIKLKDGQ